MEIATLNSPSMTNMNEDDLLKTIKGQRGSKKGDHHEVLNKELKAFKESWSGRSREELLEALMKVKKCELEMRLGFDGLTDRKP